MRHETAWLGGSSSFQSWFPEESQSEAGDTDKTQQALAVTEADYDDEVSLSLTRDYAAETLNGHFALGVRNTRRYGR